MKTAKRIVTVFCVLALVCALSVTAFAGKAPSVVYDDVTEKFIFDVNSASNPTDLFDGFKDVMPGDELTQSILITNKESNRMNVKIFMRSLGAAEGSEELLSKMTLTVAQKDETPFFAAPANETATLSDWVELGTLAKGGSVVLNVTLSVPIELSNEFQKAIGTLKWEFKSEEQPIEPNTGDKCDVCGHKMHKKIIKGNDGKYYYYYECPNEKNHTLPSPVTGEFFNSPLLITLTAVCVAAILICIFAVYKSRKREL